jgi:hypothetical protein
MCLKALCRRRQSTSFSLSLLLSLAIVRTAPRAEKQRATDSRALQLNAFLPKSLPSTFDNNVRNRIFLRPLFLLLERELFTAPQVKNST